LGVIIQLGFVLLNKYQADNVMYILLGATPDSKEDKTSGSGGVSIVMILAVVVGAGVVVIISLVAFFVLSKRFKKGNLIAFALIFLFVLKHIFLEQNNTD